MTFDWRASAEGSTKEGAYVWHVRLAKDGPLCIRPGPLQIAYVWSDNGEVIPAATEKQDGTPLQRDGKWLRRAQPKEAGWLSDFLEGAEP